MERKTRISQKKELIIFLILIVITTAGVVYSFPKEDNLNNTNNASFFKSEKNSKIFSSNLAMNTLPLKPNFEDSRVVFFNEFQELTSFEDLQKVFNQDKGNVRLVSLLSASCGPCVKGFRYLRKILEEIPDERLKMYVIWEPMLSADTRSLSKKLASKGSDPRIVYQAWDANQITGKKWGDMMYKKRKSIWTEKNAIAWDVYFLYNENAQWNKKGPTPPQFWQHQLSFISSLSLSYPELKAKVVEFLAQLDKK